MRSWIDSGVPRVPINNAGALASADTILDSDIESWWETHVSI
jgi:glutaminase